MLLHKHVQRMLEIDPEQKPQVYLRIFRSAEVASFNYILELLLSAGIATLGLVLNSPAVVIGAMLISPLMGPILAVGLALAASDLYLGIKSLASLLQGMIIPVVFSSFLVWLLPFHLPTQEILARIRPNLLDLGIALLSGIAGAVLVCRGGGNALPGVAIAVALMPPLCVVGFGIGSGMSWPIISGAGLLFLTNLAAIVASAFLVFVLVQIDSPDVRQRINQLEIEHAESRRFYRLLRQTRVGRSLGDIGSLRWRVIMLLVALAILFVPLRNSFYQLRDESVTQSAVRDALRIMGPDELFLGRQIDQEPQRTVVRLVVSAPVAQTKIDEAERLLLKRTGKEATIKVRTVASDEELATLRERLARPVEPSLPLPPPTLESLQSEILARLDPPLRENWPSDSATLSGYEIRLSSSDPVLVLHYTAPRPLDPAVQDVLTRILRERLKTGNLQVTLDWQRPPAAATAKKRTAK